MVSLLYFSDIILGPGVDSASNRNEYQEYLLGGKGGRCLRLTTLLPLCAVCLDICETQPQPGAVQACNGIALIFVQEMLMSFIFL